MLENNTKILIFLITILCVDAVQVYNMMQVHQGEQKHAQRDKDNRNVRRTFPVKENKAGNIKDKIVAGKINHKIINTKLTTANKARNKIKSNNSFNQQKPILIEEQTGTEATLPCNISNIDESENVTLKWIKRENNSVTELTKAEFYYYLTDKGPKSKVVEHTVSPDKRFMSVIDRDNKNWPLHIRYTQNADEGLYQCQIYSEKLKSTVNVSVELVEAYAEIIGDSVICINGMKPLRLSCVLKNSTEPPEYIFWYHNDRVINWDLGDNAHVREGDKGSELIFAKPNSSNGGNYTCVPSNAKQASVYIRYEVDLPSTCDLPPLALLGMENGAGVGIATLFFNRKKLHLHGDHIVNMLVLISTFHLYR